MSLDLDRRLALSPHADLKRRGEVEILVLPERALRLGGSGPEILKLCDGARSGREVVAAMRSAYASEAGIDDEVQRFLEEMLAIGGLVAVDGGAA